MGGKEGEENREGDFGLRPQHSADGGNEEGRGRRLEGRGLEGGEGCRFCHIGGGRVSDLSVGRVGKKRKKGGGGGAQEKDFMFLRGSATFLA